jgi:hypothetical protein
VLIESVHFDIASAGDNLIKVPMPKGLANSEFLQIDSDLKVLAVKSNQKEILILSIDNLE